MDHTHLIDKFSAHNYDPLSVTIAEGEGCWVYDTDGKKYLDLLAGYSAVNFGHCNEDIIFTAARQLETITLTSRAFNNNQLGPFCSKLAKLCNKDKVLPMNTGAEGVETAIKLARRWGYTMKGIPEDRAFIVVCDNNFHGRTTTVISFSSDPYSREGFGPFTPGFISIPYSDSIALEDVLRTHGKSIAAFIFEPVQGEAGVIIPHSTYLSEVRRICSDYNVMMIADEIQSGLGRTGATFACELFNVEPDVYILGKALGGGIMPLSAVVTNQHIMNMFTPGSHGSTFGGNPLACAIGSTVIDMLTTGIYQANAEVMGKRMHEGLKSCSPLVVSKIRGIGLWFGVDIQGPYPARYYGEKLMEAGILTKETHDKTLRFSPALCIDEETIDWAIERIKKVLVI